MLHDRYMPMKDQIDRQTGEILGCVPDYEKMKQITTVEKVFTNLKANMKDYKELIDDIKNFLEKFPQDELVSNIATTTSDNDGVIKIVCTIPENPIHQEYLEGIQEFLNCFEDMSVGKFRKHMRSALEFLENEYKD